jgi:hypothetical protein
VLVIPAADEDFRESGGQEELRFAAKSGLTALGKAALNHLPLDQPRSSVVLDPGWTVASAEKSA